MSLLSTKAKLGKRYRDKITGFEGTATALHEYLYGCQRVTLSGINKNTGEPADFIFDSPGVEEIKNAETVEPKQDTGGPHDRTPPARRI